MNRRTPEERLVFVDTLRGVAACAVLFHHATLLPTTEAAMPNVVPACLLALSSAGSLGVQIFFTLSGFVIAHSLRHNALTLRELGNFMLRRQCRLDPPYWAVLIVILIEAGLRAGIPSLHADPLPTFRTVIGNAFYLQNIAGLPTMLIVAWTLCLEVQFYLFFLILLRLGRMMTSSVPGRIGGVTFGLVFSTGVLSLLLAQWPYGYQWFSHYWFYFAAGIMAYWIFQRHASRRWLFAFLGCYTAAAFWALISPVAHTGYLAQEAEFLPLLVGLLTTVALWYSAETGTIFRWSGGALTQFLGRISYSLYLTHFLVCSAVLRLGHRLTGTDQVAGMFWVVLAMAASILAAWGFYLVVERPSMRLASYLKINRAAGAIPCGFSDTVLVDRRGPSVAPVLTGD